ncbi:MAG: helicase-associated domain-containing protein [Planctomycetota bacterium]|nr:helicase-associated domain-containing protein [Planctomycetota bacterium]
MSQTKGRRPPRPLKLKKHLNHCTVSELEEFQNFWSPHQKNGSLKRDTLIEKLYRVMSDENVVYAKVELLSEKVRAVLLALLKSAHYTTDLQGIFRTNDPIDLEYYEAEAALTALSKRGFVCVRRAKDWPHFGRNTYAIPLETAEVMQGLAGSDRRSLAEIFRRSTYTPSSFEENAGLAAAEAATDIGAAIEALKSEKLKQVARIVLEEFGGIVTRHEFTTVLKARKLHWASNRFLRAFGGAGLGTVGHIDLRNYGLGVDDDALLFFSEVVERHLDAWRNHEIEHDRILTAHGDLMTDVNSALHLIRELPVRVGKDGAVYKAARTRIAERLVFPEQPLIERTDLADRVLAIVHGLKLAENDGDGALALTGEGQAWGPRALLEKVQAGYDVLAEDGHSPTLRSHHLRRVREIVVELLTDPAHRDSWFPGASLAMIARNRYLLELVSAEPATPNTTLLVRHGALTELGRAAQDLLHRTFFPLGLIDIAMAGDEPVGVRLSALGRRLLLDQDTPDAASRPLIVNPDFELLVLPEGAVDDLLHALDQIAVRVRTGEVLHYRLDRQMIERATVGGMSSDELIAFLSRNARAALPQNVEYSIRSWSSDVRSGTLARGILFRASDPSVIDAVCAHSLLKECVEDVIDRKTIFFNERILDKQIEQELRAMGIYVV